MKQTENSKKQISVFTAKEKVILDYILKGKNAEDIARELSISLQKVHAYRRNMLKKANAEIAFGAIAYSYFAGVQTAEDLDLSFIQ